MYPNEKISELNIYIENFNNDINSMITISEKINDWTNRGVHLESCCEPLQNQIDSWKNTMNNIIVNFKNNILELKKHDDRISDNDTINIDELTGTYVEKWNYLYNIYQNIFTNLKKDIEILNNVTNDLNKYNDLGVKLGNATDIINEQINDINKGIDNSLSDLDDIINMIKDESIKIKDVDEVIEEVSNNNYLALYANASSDANSFSINLHANTNVNWNPEVDGNKISTYVTKVIFDNYSPLYDIEKGTSAILTNTETPYKYLYYGFDKNEMIKEEIDNTDYGIQYADQLGYSYTINLFYSPLWQSYHLDNFKCLMANKGQTYVGGQISIDKLYIVLATEEIINFSNITFNGE